MKTAREYGPLKREHIFLIQRWRNQQMDVLRQKKKLTRAGQVRWFDSLKKNKNQKLFAIYETCEGEKKFVGYCGLVHMDHLNRRAETSFLAATPRTKDWAVYTEDMLSTAAFLADYAFKVLKFKRIHSETFAFRHKHIKILERFGFKREGVLRAHVFVKGRFHDSIVHGILKDEYPTAYRKRIK